MHVTRKPFAIIWLENLLLYTCKPISIDTNKNERAAYWL